jgi:riboflavin synthase
MESVEAQILYTPSDGSTPVFTGITEATAQVLGKTGSTLTVERPRIFTDLKVGSSVAISGVCLTVVRLESRKVAMVFDVVPETLERTTLGNLRVGDRVNLERALRTDARFEGHIVQGHVDAVGVILSLTREDGVGQVRKVRKGGEGGKRRHSLPGSLTISYPKKLRGLIVEKGSIAVDGVSLTIITVTPDTFSVALIPLTRERTTLGSLRAGNEVNLEVDLLARYLRAAGNVVE